MSDVKFDRAELEISIDTYTHYAPSSNEGSIAQALRLALAVVDAAVDGGWYCYVCRRFARRDGHTPNCPVKACADAGLCK